MWSTMKSNCYSFWCEI